MKKFKYMEIGMTPNTYLFFIFPNSPWTISGRLVNEYGLLGISLANYPPNRPKKTLYGPLFFLKSGCVFC